MTDERPTPVYLTKKQLALVGALLSAKMAEDTYSREHFEEEVKEILVSVNEAILTEGKKNK